MATSSSDEDVGSAASTTVSATPGTPYEKGSPVFKDFVISRRSSRSPACVRSTKDAWKPRDYKWPAHAC